MADDEIQRGIEFLVQQQAQYTARLEKDESRLAELEEYFKMLVELARGSDERLDSHAARFESDEVRLAELEESFKMLVELARRAEERQDTMGETMATLSHTMNELMQRTITDESRLASLEESFKMLVALAHKHR